MKRNRRQKRANVNIQFEEDAVRLLDTFRAKHGLGRAPAVRMIVLDRLSNEPSTSEPAREFGSKESAA